MLVLYEPEVDPQQRMAPCTPEGNEAVADPILRHWERARHLGIKQDGPAYPTEIDSAELTRRRAHMEPLWREARPAFESLAAEMTGHGLSAVLADADGILLQVRNGSQIDSPRAQACLAEGTCWSEAVRGTNGIGTALAERAEVAVLGQAHYEEANHLFDCRAVPICNLFDEVLVVLDITARSSRPHFVLRAPLGRWAQAIEHAARVCSYAEGLPGGLLGLEVRLLERRDAVVLVERPGVVRLANAAAVARIGQPALMDGTALVEKALGIRMDALLQHVQSGEPLSGPAGRRLVAEPVRNQHGQVLSVIVCLEEAATRILPASEHPAFAVLLGKDERLARARQQGTRLARSGLPVLLLAETGTGKDLMARAIHQASPRAGGPFIALNCGVLSTSVGDSDLFGYAPGAFTGALPGGSEGKLGAACGGTLFLDEIADLPPPLQVHLLRVLDGSPYYRVGDARPRTPDVRVVAATCKDLSELVARGVFREDLFYRLNGACIRLPSLRERTDRVDLARALLRDMCGPRDLGEDALASIERYPFPGNVRQLKYALEQAIVQAREEGSEVIRGWHLPIELQDATLPQGAGPMTTLRQGQVEQARRALQRAGGNVSAAARQLGVARSTLYRILGRPGH